MPNPNFKKTNALYKIGFVGDKYLTLLEDIRNSPVYKSQTANILIEGKEIYFGYGLREIENLFPALAHSLVGNRRLTESNYRAYENIHIYITPAQKPLAQLQYELQDVAKEFFTGFKQKESKVLTANLPTDPNKAFVSLAATHQGVCVGEVHSMRSPKKLLVDNMPALKEAKVTTLFCEHVLDDIHKDLLDIYFKSNSLLMPAELEVYLNNLDRGHINQVEYIESGIEPSDAFHPYSFTGLIVQAKRYGIRIVPIDTTVSYTLQNPEQLITDTHLKARALMMSYSSTKIMNTYLAEHTNEKYVIFCGSLHINSTNSSVPGMAEIMGTPTVVVEDGKATELRLQPKHVANPHVLITSDTAFSDEAKALVAAVNQEALLTAVHTLNAQEKIAEQSPAKSTVQLPASTSTTSSLLATLSVPTSETTTTKQADNTVQATAATINQDAKGLNSNLLFTLTVGEKEKSIKQPLAKSAGSISAYSAQPTSSSTTLTNG